MTEIGVEKFYVVGHSAGGALKVNVAAGLGCDGKDRDHMRPSTSWENMQVGQVHVAANVWCHLGM